MQAYRGRLLAKVRSSILRRTPHSYPRSPARSGDGISFSSLSSHPEMTKGRLGKLIMGGAVAGGLGWIALNEDAGRTAKLLYAVPVRLARDIATAVTIAADYKISLYNLPEGSVEREAARQQAHFRCANRLQALCFKNGGIYIKLGQHVGQLDYLVPQEYVQTMRNSMLNKCPVSTYKEVCDVFLTELGHLPDEVFAEFDPVPLASASLAQVHTACTKDGQKVAVKVQHMHLTDTAAADTATVDIVVNLLHWLFPSFDYRWLLAEVKESVPKELDFINEAKNSEECMRNFAKMSPKVAQRILVPKIMWELSTPKLLVMEYMEGVEVTDVSSIKKLGLQPADVAYLALVLADVPNIKAHSIRLGAGEDLYVLFAGVLTMRPWDSIVDHTIDHLNLPDTLEGRAKIQKYASQYLTEVSELLRRLPRVVLLLLKTNDCLRAVDNALGAPVNTFLIVARESSRALVEIQAAKGLTLLSYCSLLFDRIEVEFRLWSLMIMAWIAQARRAAYFK